MKRKLVVLLSIVSTLAVSGCNNKKNDERFLLSYGSYIDSTATAISYATLQSMVANEESFILALSPGNEASITCNCWKTFSFNINKYVKENAPIIYKADVYNIAAQEERFGLVAPSMEDPTIAFFKNGKLVKQYMYSSKNTPEYFYDVDALAKFIDSLTLTPKALYISEGMLETKIANKESFVISYVRNQCSDCKDILPNVFDPYLKTKNTKELYLLDLQDIYTTPDYQEFKDQYLMSNKNSEAFGYGDGVVPTTHYYSNGELADASVYFNDSVAKDSNGNYYISNSFYSEARASNLRYEHQVLQGKTINENEVLAFEYDSTTYYFWISEYARVYHKANLESFLNMYLAQ